MEWYRRFVQYWTPQLGIREKEEEEEEKENEKKNGVMTQTFCSKFDSLAGDTKKKEEEDQEEEEKENIWSCS